MLIGPIFNRELITSARRTRTYISRGVYLSSLLILMCTAWLVFSGVQPVYGVRDLARFGSELFNILAPLQLSLAIFFAALLTAGTIAREKDRKTLLLLLLTDMTSAELVLGQVFASLLGVLSLVFAALPLFLIIMLFGGIDLDQIIRVYLVTIFSVLVAGSTGAMVAYWREKTFQTLALTALVMVFWLGLGELVRLTLTDQSLLNHSSHWWAAAVCPWQALMTAATPVWDSATLFSGFESPTLWFVIFSGAGFLMINLWTIYKVRHWNPSREIIAQQTDQKNRETIWSDQAEEHQIRQSEKKSIQREQEMLEARLQAHRAPGKVRAVWQNPILWREICTWAYGRKILLIRLGYLLLFVTCVFVIRQNLESLQTPNLQALTSFQGISQISAFQISGPLIALLIISLMLVNALSVTSITSERDGRCLDLILATDLTPKEIVYGKLGGVFYNTKEMILLPLLVCWYLWSQNYLSLENCLYLNVGFLVLFMYAAMLGLHCGMMYLNSGYAVAISLGTLFFLVVGIATCIAIMVAFSDPYGDSFQVQLAPFLAFIVGGSIGLYFATGAKSPSAAIGWAALICPMATFWAITSYFLGYSLAIFLVTTATYGFATIGMLIPALFEFDITTGRTSSSD